jgi:hypothetical protein
MRGKALRTTVSVPVLAALAALVCIGAAPVRAADPAAPASAPAPAVSAVAASATPAPAAAAPDSAKPVKAKTKKARVAKKVAADTTAKPSTPVDTAKAPAMQPKEGSVPAPALVDTTNKTAAAPDTGKAKPVDSAKAAVAPPAPDSAKSAAVASADSSARIAADTSASDSAAGKPKKRKRIVRETTVNTIDELKGRYRSPKKALFMSLIVPGLGQAYVGQHWSNYARGAVYFLADAALLYGWHEYVVVKQDREINRYKHFADLHWRQRSYEDSIGKQLNATEKEKFDKRNPHRQTYCESVQEAKTESGKNKYRGCTDPIVNTSEYNSFYDFYKDYESGPVDSISAQRAAFFIPLTFYEIIGKEPEFITGWDDANDNPILFGDTTYTQLNSDNKPVAPTTRNQQAYVSMRDKANEYARMQAYFLGGMVLNHIVSALDAALTAHFHNRSLYQTDVSWYDRVRLDSYVAWEGGLPKPTMAAYVTF